MWCFCVFGFGFWLFDDFGFRILVFSRACGCIVFDLDFWWLIVAGDLLWVGLPGCVLVLLFVFVFDFCGWYAIRIWEFVVFMC